MNNGSCEFESHLGHQKVVGATALATFFLSRHAHPESRGRRRGRYHDRPSPRLMLLCALLSPSCVSLPQGHLHGVSHDAASPMPVASNFGVVGICGICPYRLAYKYRPLNYH